MKKLLLLLLLPLLFACGDNDKPQDYSHIEKAIVGNWNSGTVLSRSILYIFKEGGYYYQYDLYTSGKEAVFFKNGKYKILSDSRIQFCEIGNDCGNSYTAFKYIDENEIEIATGPCKRYTGEINFREGESPEEIGTSPN